MNARQRRLHALVWPLIVVGLLSLVAFATLGRAPALPGPGPSPSGDTARGE